MGLIRDPIKGFRGQPRFLRGLVSRCGLATQPLFEVLPYRRLCRPELGALYSEDMVARVTTVFFLKIVCILVWKNGLLSLKLVIDTD